VRWAVREAAARKARRPMIEEVAMFAVEELEEVKKK
jgi:hypothetical protein